MIQKIFLYLFITLSLVYKIVKFMFWKMAALQYVFWSPAHDAGIHGQEQNGSKVYCNKNLIN